MDDTIIYGGYNQTKMNQTFRGWGFYFNKFDIKIRNITINIMDSEKKRN